jgi:HSP20 family protein
LGTVAHVLLQNSIKMTLIKFKTNNPVRRNERMPLFSDLFNDLFETVNMPDVTRGTVPSVNIIENDDNYRLELAAPGLKKDDFKISIDDDRLTVSSEKETESTDKQEKYTRKEFSYSSFMRTFTLPEMVDSEKISAKYEDGVMTVLLPKKEEAKPKTPREVKVS